MCGFEEQGRYFELRNVSSNSFLGGVMRRVKSIGDSLFLLRKAVMSKALSAFYNLLYLSHCK